MLIRDLTDIFVLAVNLTHNPLPFSELGIRYVKDKTLSRTLVFGKYEAHILLEGDRIRIRDPILLGYL